MREIDLRGKKILVGVTGSISAYKACELVRAFVRSGADVRVVMSKGAVRFVSPLTFEALTRNRVLFEDSEDWSSQLNHIDYAKWADVFVIAPITANSINKLAKGIADTILLQTALAYRGTLIVAPAANTAMLENHYTAGSLKMLVVNDVVVVKPVSKKLACGDEGSGALASIQEIYWQTSRELFREEFWDNRKVVVTGGGTREAIDSFRYISNRSSGKMGLALAEALYLRGADVCYISTMPHDELPSEVYTIDVESAKDMYDYTIDAVRVAKKGKMSKASMNRSEPISLIKKKPYLFMVAAVSDYRPAYPQEGKLKKSDLGDEWELKLVKNPDILSDVDKNYLVTVGFKAESDEEMGLDNAKKLLEEKGVDAVCYNHIASSDSFGSDDNEIIFISKEEIKKIDRADKLSVAIKILKESEKLSNE